MRITTAVATTAILGALAAGTLGVAASAGAATGSHTAAARADWTKGAHAVAAEQGRYWAAARHELAAYGTRYFHERADLTTLAAIPLTNTTAHQRATATRVTRELDGFFHTPNLYGVPVGNAKSHARTDWVRSTKVAAAEQNVWLAAAVDELDAAGSRYHAARADLISLQSIPLTDVTATQRATAHHDVQALDAFFATPGLGE